ncbi:sulfotransferase domain-containing protein [Agaribacter flavus]|uniref:Sulfotransferase domain-containing protein n=1 Tax=Agaribacter flavus TaxID=1902781 RepID=A0ABV7FQD9_9ALTE
MDSEIGDHPDALFSYEALTGQHLNSAFVNRTQVAKRLQQYGFEKVIISIRNQYDVLESAYRQYIKSGGVCAFENFVNFKSTHPRFMHPHYFNYYLIYKLYSELFGKKNILVLQYEDMKTEAFWRSLNSFLETEIQMDTDESSVNSSLSYNKTKLLRLLNNFAHSPYNRSALITPKFSSKFIFNQLQKLPNFSKPKQFSTIENKQEIGDFYAQSNRRLEKSANIRLCDKYPKCYS